MGKRAKGRDLWLDLGKYIADHPDERFWQALRNWAKVDSICIQNGIETLDTFYWETKTK